MLTPFTASKSTEKLMVVQEICVNFMDNLPNEKTVQLKSLRIEWANAISDAGPVPILNIEFFDPRIFYEPEEELVQPEAEAQP